MPNAIQKAGAIILSPSNDPRVALLYRAKQNDWTFPKGHIDEGETAGDTLIREIKEETDLSVSILSPLPDNNYLNASGEPVSIKMFLVRAQDDAEYKPEFPGDKLEFFGLEDVINVLSYPNLKEYFNSIVETLTELALN